MRKLDIAKTEALRVLAVASQYVGYECTLEELASEANSQKASAETREEISYLIAATKGRDYDQAMVINISDNLIRKFENQAFAGAVGFGLLEKAFGGYSQSGKFIIGSALVLILQVGTGIFLAGSDFRALDQIELILQGLAMWLMVGSAGILLAWVRTLNASKSGKTISALIGYAFFVLYGYVLVSADLGAFDFDLTFTGAHWLIVFSTFVPILMPISLLAFNVANQPVGSINNKSAAYEPLQENSIDLVQQRVNSGFIQLDPEGRSDHIGM